MKKIFFLTALAVMVLASCNRNEDEMGSVGGEKATLNISIQSPETYAGLTAAPTDVVGNYTVFITDQTDEIVPAWSRYSSSNAALSEANGTAIEVTTQAKHVYVVVNGGNLTSITTMAVLNAKIIDLNGSDVAAGKQMDTRWATGHTTTPLTFTQSGTAFKATTTVPVTFVAARIKVTIALDGDMADYYNPSASNGSLQLTGVAVLNARGQSKIFGSSLIPTTYDSGKKFYEGMANSSFEHYPATATDFTYTPAAGFLSDNTLVTDYNASTKFTGKEYYYYVFENDATAAADLPTIVLLKGTYDSQDIYFPVHLAGYDATAVTSAGITRGNSYNVAITLKGDPRRTEGGSYPGGTGGTDDPTEPLITATVDVAVSLTPWNPISVPKTFE